MPDRAYALKAFAVMAAATFPSRLFPFMIPKRWRESRRLRFIGENLPASAMFLLVVYCLKGTVFVAPPYGLPEVFSVAAVVVVHLWRRNGLLSIGSGTGLYVLLVRTGAIERLLAR